MADTSDVQNALVNTLDLIIYPDGDSAASSVGCPVKLYRGFSNSPQLDIDLAAGIAHVSVDEQTGYARLEPGYLDPPTDTMRTSTLTVSVTGSSVTFGGTPGLRHLMGVSFAGMAYAYSLTSQDTLAAAAAALAALIAAGNGIPITQDSGLPLAGLNEEILVSVSGSTITIGTNAPIRARVGCYGTTQTLDRWMNQGFRVSIWAPTPLLRDVIASRIDSRMARIKFLALPDGQGGRLVWHNTFSEDAPQKEQLWKRHIIYTVLFATSVTEDAPQVLWSLEAISPMTSTGTVISAGVTIVS